MEEEVNKMLKEDKRNRSLGVLKKRMEALNMMKGERIANQRELGFMMRSWLIGSWVRSQSREERREVVEEHTLHLQSQKRTPKGWMLPVFPRRDLTHFNPAKKQCEVEIASSCHYRRD